MSHDFWEPQGQELRQKGEAPLYGHVSLIPSFCARVGGISKRFLVLGNQGKGGIFCHFSLFQMNLVKSRLPDFLCDESSVASACARVSCRGDLCPLSMVTLFCHSVLVCFLSPFHDLFLGGRKNWNPFGCAIIPRSFVSLDTDISPPLA